MAVVVSLTVWLRKVGKLITDICTEKKLSSPTVGSISEAAWRE
jgi:hypothetical protein